MNGAIRSLVLLAAPVLAVLVAACGGGESASPAERIPADALVYGEVVVRPEGDLQENLEQVLAKFPEGDQAGEALVEAIDAEDDDDDVTYEQDIEPWLGERVAAFGVAGDDGEVVGAGLVEVTDEEAAREFLERDADEDAERREHGGVELLVDDEGFAGAVFDGLVVFGDEAAVERAIDAGEGEVLADEERYSEAIERSESDTRVALGYLDLARLLETVPPEELDIPGGDVEGFLSSVGADPEVPITLSVAVEDDVVRIDQASAGEPTPGAGDALGALPGDALLALALPQLPAAFTDGFEFGFYEGAAEDGLSREQAERAAEEAFGLDPIALLESIEGISAYVRGGLPDLAGSVLVELGGDTDPADTVAALRRVLSENGIPTAASPQGAGSGFVVRVPGLPFAPLIVEDGTRIVAATSPDELQATRGEGVQTLEESGVIDDARELLGDGYEPVAVADGEALVQAIGAVAAGSEGLSEVFPYLEPIGRISAGTSSDGELVLQRVAIQLE